MNKLEIYHQWIIKQSEALQRIKEFKENAEMIKDKKNRVKYLRNAKHEFDTEFSNKFAKRNN